MDQLWFKAKCFGWGWYPCSWQGWLVLLLFVATLISLSWMVVPGSWMWFLLLIIIVGLLMIICFLTGERPRWRWGN
ncbi:MAG TPA: hypothetical protein VJB87_01835 [Candidatus Nanoarchaeia archaeon]|nr:hypothetical protein [Candidatus Nanoarchaeia archaeon]